MEKRGGRPPGRALTQLELRHLKLLVDARARAEIHEILYKELLQDFALELHESGCSSNGIAKAIGRSPSTVDAWIDIARRRRDEVRPQEEGP